MRHNQSDVDNPWVGPDPAFPGCDCQICRPEKYYDKIDQNCLDTVLKHGWQVILVGVPCDHGGECDEGPSLPFAYTLGLGHRCGHPEFFMSGLEPRLMHAVLNRMAERVMAGNAYFHGDVVEGALGGVPVVLEKLAEDHIAEAIPWAGWFHRHKPEALSLVWPTTGGIFAWQPGAPVSLDQHQPPQWRVPSPRTDGIAPDPEWLFPITPEALVLSCTHVIEGGAPVLWAARKIDKEGEEDWTVHCGGVDHATNEVCASHFTHLVRSAPSLRMISDLPVNFEALRASVDDPWIISEILDYD